MSHRLEARNDRTAIRWGQLKKGLDGMTAKAWPFSFAHRACKAGLCALAAVIVMAGCQRNISGSYIASDSSSVCWLQLVRTPDNHLTGQLAESILKPDGTVEQNSTAVTGAVDGENVSVSGSGFLGLQSFTLAGTLSGDTLTLTGVQSIPIAFRRSTPVDYHAKVADLNARSQSILHAKAVVQAQQRTFQAQADFVVQVDQLIGRMTRFDLEADIHLARFPGAEKSYTTITGRIEAYVARERQLAGNPNTSVMRGQLSVAATQASLLTEQMHNQGVSLQSALEGNIKPLADQATAFEQQCHAVSQSSGNLTPAEIQNVNAACDRLTGADVPFQQKYAAMSDGLAHLEQVYQRERNTQEGLIQESERLE
jgi:hypothetical protein